MLTIIIVVIIIFVLLLLLVSFGTFCGVEHKNYSSKAKNPRPESPLYQERESFLSDDRREEWKLTTADGLILRAWYLPADKTTAKTVLMANGYHSVREEIAMYGWLFHDLGYNVLLCEHRGSPESAGKYIGFGWLDRADYRAWLDCIIEKNGENSEIAMWGISMGGAATMMLSGENLPDNVKCFISDCGYDSVWNELVYRNKRTLHLAAFPMVYLLSFWSKVLAGYDWREASAVKQLEKNQRPILLIHGEKDDFVPTEMVYRNAAATQGPKKVVIIPEAGHAMSYRTNKELYRATIQDFLEEYFQ